LIRARNPALPDIEISGEFPAMMFDAAIYLVMFVAVVAGFGSGFLRSAVTIVAYVAAMPIAAALMPLISPQLAAQSHLLERDHMPIFFGVFLIVGTLLGALLRLAVHETVGARIGIPDRLAGSLLGVVRIGLVAVLLVLAFDRLIPQGREPSFLRGSQLRPYLSLAGQAGLRSLPPETTAFIDQIKRERGL
jgi:membrane protein required for colicin V production